MCKCVNFLDLNTFIKTANKNVLESIKNCNICIYIYVIYMYVIYIYNIYNNWVNFSNYLQNYKCVNNL